MTDYLRREDADRIGAKMDARTSLVIRQVEDGCRQLVADGATREELRAYVSEAWERFNTATKNWLSAEIEGASVKRKRG